MVSRLSILAVTTALTLSLAMPAFAQNSNDEVVVTATKRNETIFDVPLAVTAVTGDTLEQAQIRDISDLQNIAPSLLFSQSTGSNQTVLTIRGIGTPGQNSGLEQSVGVVIDGVFRGRPGSALNDYIDINQIEVLRGPQGTIFGKNTTAGVINVRTAKPSFDFKAKADVTLGNFDLQQYRASISGPITDTLAASLSGSRQTRDGFVTSILDGSDVNNRDRWSVRGQLLWEPTDDISLRIIGDHAEGDENCCAAVPVLLGPSAGLIQALGGTLPPTTPGTLGGSTGGLVDFDERVTTITPEQPLEDPLNDTGISGELTWDLGPVVATALAAYREFESVPLTDGDISTLNLFTATTAAQDLDEVSLEFRLTSDTDGPFEWIAGAYLFNQDIEANQFLAFGPDTRNFFAAVTPTVPNPLTMGTTTINVLNLIEALTMTPPNTFFAEGVVSDDNFFQDSNSFAFFGNATWHVTDRLDITGGVRYTNESKDADFQINNTGAFSQLPLGLIAGGMFSGLSNLQTVPAVVPFQAEFDDDDISIAASLSYEVSDALNLYARFSQGYKSGGFNLNRNGPNTAPGAPGQVSNFAALVAADPTLTPLQSLQDAVTFQPENTNAYELGFKSRFLENRLKLDGTFFFQSVEDFQANAFNGTTFSIINAGEVESFGFELDYSFAITEDLFLTGGGSFQDVEYASFTNSGATNAQIQAGMPVQDLTGERPNFASDVVLTGALNYKRDLTEKIGLNSRVGYRYRSEYTTAQDNDPTSLQDGFVTIDATLGFEFYDGLVGLDFWGKNLTDQTIRNITFDTPFQAGSFSAFLEAPRTYGATLRFNY